MIDSEKKIFEAFAKKAFKLTAEELAGLYNDAGELTDLTLIETRDSERISKLSTEKTNQYNRGLKEGATKLEKELKEKYEVDSDLIGVELFDHVLTTKLEEVKGAGDGEILKHPEVVKLISEHSKALKAKDKEWQKKLDDQVALGKKAELFNGVRKNAFVIFDGEKYILPEDPKRAQAQRDVFASRLEKGNFQPDGETFIVLKEDGNPLQDDHGHSITFEDYVKSIGDSLFDKMAADDRSSGANNNGQAQRKPLPKIKNRDEYTQKMKEAKTPEERLAIGKAFGILT